MKKYTLLFSLLLLLACSTGPRDTKLTPENRQSIVTAAMPEMSEAEMKSLLAYVSRQATEQISKNIISGLQGKPGGEWDVLPEGKSINEILKEQKAYEAAQP